MVMTRGGMEIRLVDQESPGAAGLLRELHDDVLRPSFRPEEYVSPTVINPAKKLAIIARADDGLVVGGALGEAYPHSRVLLLGYLAVRPGLRGKGIGSVLMAALKERWLDRDGENLAVLEIDDPRYHAPHPDHGDPAARLRFYGAFGVRLLGIPYFQPRLRDHLPRDAQRHGVVEQAEVRVHHPRQQRGQRHQHRGVCPERLRLRGGLAGSAGSSDGGGPDLRGRRPLAFALHRFSGRTTYTGRCFTS